MTMGENGLFDLVRTTALWAPTGRDWLGVVQRWLRIPPGLCVVKWLERFAHPCFLLSFWKLYFCFLVWWLQASTLERWGLGVFFFSTCGGGELIVQRAGALLGGFE